MKTQKLAIYLRTHRKNAGLTKTDIAYLLDCNPEAVAKHEKGGRFPGPPLGKSRRAPFGQQAQDSAAVQLELEFCPS